MILKDSNIHTAPFSELVAVPAAQAINPAFDIIIEGDITLENYCKELLSKILELPQSQFSAFINYQTNQVNDVLKWLNKLEKLIALNGELFESVKNKCRFTKMYTLIEKKRFEVQYASVKKPIIKTPRRLINADTEDRYFSFHEVKQHIETLENFNDKIIYLSEEIFDYEEADIISINKNLGEFNLQCVKLKVRLQTTRKLLLDIEKEQLQNQTKMALEIKPTFKIRLNGPINILTDAYKQMMQEVKPNGKPYIQHKIKEIAKFICDHYLDEKGNELSILTIQTYLSPTRTDKNPNNDWKIKL